MVERFLSIQHSLNPLHVYCRLLDRGLGRGLSATICKSYEIAIYVWISWIVKTMVHFFCVMNSSFSIQREMRKSWPESIISIKDKFIFQQVNWGIWNMLWARNSLIDRRSEEDRRTVYNPDYFLNGGVERRRWTERRSQVERRLGWIRLNTWYSVPLRAITKANSLWHS